MPDSASPDAHQCDFGAEKPAEHAEQEHGVRKPPGPQRQARLKDSHARHYDDVMPADPGRSPEYVGALAKHLEHDRRHTGCPLVMRLIPVQRDSRNAVSRGNVRGSTAHRVENRAGMMGPEVAENCLHRSVVADVARPEVAEYADARSDCGPV